MANKYSFQRYDEKKMVMVRGRHIPISLKTTTEVLRFIKGRNADKAISLLEEVNEAKRAIPFLRYKRDIPHRKGKMSVGRFPKKVSESIIKLLESLKANAKDKGFDEKSLSIIHAAAQQGPNLWHYGRHRRRMRKVCHVEIVAQEIKKKEIKKK